MNKERWLRAIQELPAQLAMLDPNEHQAQRDAVLGFWQLIAAASSPIRKTYERIGERELRAHAEQALAVLGRPGFGFDAKGIGSDTRLGMLRLAAHLRALDLALSDADLGSISGIAEDYLVSFGDEDGYLIAVSRQLWRDSTPPVDDTTATDPKPEHTPPPDDFRPFSQRGLVRHRLIPTEVDGARVRLRRLQWPGVRDRLKHFGAVLFPSLDFDCDEDDTSFLVRGVSCAGQEAIIADALRESHLGRCFGTIFPELTISPDDCRAIVGQLRAKPWLETSPEADARTPALVVAGSWHVERDGSHYNLATLLDGDGNPLGEYIKRLPFTDPDGRIERIESGEELVVLVFETCLIAFGICLDFCDRRYQNCYDALDVDFVLVPSCGNDSTMKGHIRNAELLWLRRTSLSVVVQQAYPLRSDMNPGYLLPPAIKIASDPRQLVCAVPWTILTSPLTTPLTPP